MISLAWPDGYGLVNMVLIGLVNMVLIAALAPLLRYDYYSSGPGHRDSAEEVER